MRIHPATFLAPLASALLCYGTALLVPQLDLMEDLALADILPGLIFGLLVLVSRETTLWTAIALVLASTAAYWGARETAFVLHVQSSWPAMAACALAGTLAAFVLSVLYCRLARNARAWPDNLRAAAIGGFAGVLLGLGIRAGDDVLTHALLFSGYALWQTGFAFVHEIVPAWWPAAPRRA